MHTQTLRRALVLAVVLNLAVLSFGGGLQETDTTGFLTEIDDLEGLLDNPRAVLIDARSFDDYSQGFIPGAVNLFSPSLDRTITLEDGTQVAAMVQTPEEIIFPLQDAGISKNSSVYIYDAGRSSLASRLFWVLDYYGHKNVSIVNGGVAKWVAEGNELSTVVQDVPAGNFVPTAQPEKLADFDYVQIAIKGDSILVCDALSASSYSDGAIPNTKSLPKNTTFTDEEVPYFRQAEHLETLLEDIGHDWEQEVVFYCGAGYAAAVDYFIARYIGLPNVRMYDGSLRDWTARGGELTPGGAPISS